MRRILVTAVSGDIGNCILKILNKCAPGDILFGCDINAIAVGMDIPSVFWQCKPAVDEGYIDELLNKCREHRITHIIPCNESEIWVLRHNKQKLDNIGIKLIMQSDLVLDTCLDKLNTMEFLSAHDILVPRTYKSLDELPDNGSSLKYICKSRKSNGSKGIKVYDSKSSILKESENAFKDVIFQEYIEGDEYTVGVFCCNNEISVISFKRQIKNGYTYLAELKYIEELEKIACNVSNIFNLNGYINLQLRERDGKYYIFEINPRISGTVGFRNELGFQDVIWWLDMVDGNGRYVKYEPIYKEAIGIRELSEKFLVKRFK